MKKNQNPLSIGQSWAEIGPSQIPVAFDKTNGDEVFRICALANMAIYAIEMTKLEVNGNLVALQPDDSQLFRESDVITKYEVSLSSK